MLGGCRPSSDAAIGASARSCLTLSLCRLQGSARVIRCLQEGREQLSFECRAALFDQEQDMAEDIDFKFPLRAACASEIPAFCKDVRHGHARIVRCLQARNSSRALPGLLWTSRRAVGALHVAGRSWRPLGLRQQSMCLASSCGGACPGSSSDGASRTARQASQRRFLSGGSTRWRTRRWAASAGSRWRALQNLHRHTSCAGSPTQTAPCFGCAGRAGGCGDGRRVPGAG